MWNEAVHLADLLGLSRDHEIFNYSITHCFLMNMWNGVVHVQFSRRIISSNQEILKHFIVHFLDNHVEQPNNKETNNDSVS